MSASSIGKCICEYNQPAYDYLYGKGKLPSSDVGYKCTLQKAMLSVKKCPLPIETEAMALSLRYVGPKLASSIMRVITKHQQQQKELLEQTPSPLSSNGCIVPSFVVSFKEVLKDAKLSLSENQSPRRVNEVIEIDCTSPETCPIKPIVNVTKTTIITLDIDILPSPPLSPITRPLNYAHRNLPDKGDQNMLTIDLTESPPIPARGDRKEAATGILNRLQSLRKTTDCSASSVFNVDPRKTISSIVITNSVPLSLSFSSSLPPVSSKEVGALSKKRTEGKISAAVSQMISASASASLRTDSTSLPSSSQELTHDRPPCATRNNKGWEGKYRHMSPLRTACTEYNVVLLVDERERKEREAILEELISSGVSFAITQLALGDYLFIAVPRTSTLPLCSEASLPLDLFHDAVVLDVIIERKIISDLCSSITTDNRFVEQKFRLKDCRLACKMYLVEGDTEGVVHSRLSAQSISSAISAIEIVDEIQVVCRAGIAKSMRFFLSIHKYISFFNISRMDFFLFV